MNESKKDVIYVDIEDDITSVIEKVKTAKAGIVALVPPKRIGVLQSIVNLKLLKRAATTSKKQVVLVTNDAALIGLAAGVAIPVAKNLQSKPELPEVTALKIDNDDVIDGQDLPVGELAKTGDTELSDDSLTPEDEAALAAPAPFAAKAASKAPRKSSIPNFDSFRKKLFLFGGLGLLFIAFLVWALFFAAKATVAITAQTNIINIGKTLQLVPSGKLDASQGVIPAIVKEEKKTVTASFAATGKKQVGDKATGTVKFSKSTPNDATLPAGTQLNSSSGLVFVTNSAITVTGAQLSFSCSNYLCPGSGSGGVTAAGPGANYNGATGSVSGGPSGVSGSFDGATGGGTDKTITVVTQDDVNKAKDQLQAQNTDQIKSELKKQFTSDEIVITESFNGDQTNLTSAPAVDQEAANATLTSETTFQLVGLERNDLKKVYDTYTKSQIEGQNAQKIYESGDNATAFSEFTKTASGYTVKTQATAQVGPNIDDKALAEQLKGKRAGEIQQQIEGIQGVEDVNVKLSPFWVTKAPNNAKKITIKFVVKNGQN
jgi:hypothetical protein